MDSDKDIDNLTFRDVCAKLRQLENRIIEHESTVGSGWDNTIKSIHKQLDALEQDISAIYTKVNTDSSRITKLEDWKLEHENENISIDKKVFSNIIGRIQQLEERGHRVDNQAELLHKLDMKIDYHIKDANRSIFDTSNEITIDKKVWEDIKLCTRNLLTFHPSNPDVKYLIRYISMVDSTFWKNKK